MRTQIKFNKDSSEKILKGVNTLADAVSMTLGPKARLVAIAKSTPQGDIYSRTVIDDGVGVAKAIELEDEYENLGAAILREAAQKQLDLVGDGTTAVVVLAREIVNQAMKQISEGKSAMTIRRSLEEGAELLVKEIQKLSKPITTLKDKTAIATISCKNKELGKLIAETFESVGIDGVITVEESRSSETVVEHQQGMQFDKGYYSPYFITDPSNMSATLENTRVLVTDLKISNILDYATFFEEFVKVSRTITIISPEISGDALPTFIQTKLDGKIQILCVQAPSFGQNQKDMLQDIAILTGAKFITEDAGHKPHNIKVEDLGAAKRVTSTRDTTIIVGGMGKPASIAERAVMIKQQLEAETGSFEKEKLRERLGKISNGIAVIRVGGQTEVEMHERKERVEDAIASTRSAIQGGIVAGGEVIYLKVRHAVKDNEILYQALKKPFTQLLDNSGIDNSEIMFDINSKDKKLGVDALDGTIKDMFEAGIIDPAGVSVHAIRNAVSVATQIILIGASIVPVKK